MELQNSNKASSWDVVIIRHATLSTCCAVITYCSKHTMTPSSQGGMPRRKLFLTTFITAVNKKVIDINLIMLCSEQIFLKAPRKHLAYTDISLG